MQLPADLAIDPHEAVHIAAAALDSVWDIFVGGVGAQPSVRKSSEHDFATEIDLRIESLLAQALTDATSIPVLGEEHGGVAGNTGTVWIIDPIDGTTNYSAAIPMCAMLVALVHDGAPIAGLTWLPFLGARITSALGTPLVINGEAQPPVAATTLQHSTLGLNFSLHHHGGLFSTPLRQHLHHSLVTQSVRTRVFGSRGLDLAYVASGKLHASIALTSLPWDNAAGASHILSGGALVTDHLGNPWTVDSSSVVAAVPGVHQQILDLVREAETLC